MRRRFISLQTTHTTNSSVPITLPTRHRSTVTEYPDGTTTLHVLLGRGIYDFDVDAALLTRLLNGGAEINTVIAKFGTPLETLAEKFKFTDQTLAPVV